MTFYTTGFNLGGLDWSSTDHEFVQEIGFKPKSATYNYESARDVLDNVAIIDSKWDKAIIPLLVRYG